MLAVKKLVLDVLKPHEPNALEFCKRVARAGHDYRVRLSVVEVDKRTETLQLVIEGDSIDYDAVVSAIENMGGALHSIDEVEVLRVPNAGS
ncbi:MAG: hypothetical protein DWQ08_15460 [Proteobacteria bacterium]|nr:MAG: hypothetical protein DWQ08_15460 [Pseudomonadota bacterium]